jgi:hypothetical protein
MKLRTSRGRKRFTLFTLLRQQKFLRYLGEGHTVRAAARFAGVSFMTVYNCRRADGSFAADWRIAVEMGMQAMDEECRRQGMEGVPEPVFYQGKQVAVVQRYFPEQLRFLLRGHRPGMYGGHQSDANLLASIDVSKLSLEQVEQLHAHVQAIRRLLGRDRSVVLDCQEADQREARRRRAAALLLGPGSGTDVGRRCRRGIGCRRERWVETSRRGKWTANTLSSTRRRRSGAIRCSRLRSPRRSGCDQAHRQARTAAREVLDAVLGIVA